MKWKTELVPLTFILFATAWNYGQTTVRPIPPKPAEAGDSSTRVGHQVVQAPGTKNSAAPPVGSKSNSLATTATSAPAFIGPGDLLDIDVFDTPELTAQVRVNSAGNITYSPIGDIHVGELAPEEAAALIADKLVTGQYVRHPQVSIFVQEYANQAVYVTGEVARPGVYPLLGSYRLLDILSAAGGITSLGANEASITHRDDPKHPHVLRISAQGLDGDGNPVMAAGDTVYVPQAGVVYVVGEVMRPGGFLLDKDTTLTVVQAIALAQGTTPIASRSRVRIVRTEQNGTRQVIALDLQKVLDSKRPDIQLQKNDILYVPRSTARIFSSQSFLSTVMATAAGASVYRF
jgi:polysaccharide export outer membrane protein